MGTKLWQTHSQLDSLVEIFETENDLKYDQQLIPYDVKGSMAQAAMLKKIGILTSLEEKNLQEGLKKVLMLYKNGEFVLQIGDEDMHTKIEMFLTEEYGDVGKKIHTGRSRNDQVLTALRLFTLDMLGQIKEEVKKLVDAFELYVSTHGELPMPGYTHTQRAMPSSVGMWAGSYASSGKDDIIVLQSTSELNDQLPLGSGAGFGVPMKIDRNFMAEYLGFSRVQENPMYCQNSRGKIEAHTISACVSVLQTINRFATDVLFFTSAECNFFSVDSSLCSGSSMMPQKKNVDLAELLRSKVHLVLGQYTQVVSLSSNVISGYHRDLQDMKQPLVESLTLTLQSVKMAKILLEGLQPNEEKLKNSLSPEVFATEKALTLVQEGVPFRKAYQRIKDELFSSSHHKNS